MRTGLVLAAAALSAAALLYAYNEESAGELADDAGDGDADYLGGFTDWATSAVQDAAEVIDSISGNTMKISAMARVTADQVAHPNVQAFLRVIRRGEGTADEAGFRRLFGGELFTSYADHPRRVIRKNGYASSAAGAFQFLTSSWDETRRVMGLPDFSPASQTRGAVGRIAARGALDDVIAGRFETAIRKCAKEWASLPFSPYGQPTISMSTAAAVYASAGGVAV